MIVYHCSVELPVGDVTIPAGGFTAIEFPFTSERHDPYDMHSRRAVDGTFIGGASSAVIRIPADGVAIIESEVAWKAPTAASLRNAITLDGVRTGADRRPTVAGVDNPTAHCRTARVKAGQTITLQLGHDAAGGQKVSEARFKVTVFSETAPPPARTVRVKAGTDPYAAPAEPPAQYGDGIAQTPVVPDAQQNDPPPTNG